MTFTGSWEIALLAIIVILIVNRRRLGFLKSRYYIVLGIISLAWWLFLIILELQTQLSCAPDDELCNSGNTFWGDVAWSSILAIIALSLIWLVALIIGLYIHRNKNHPTKKKK